MWQHALLTRHASEQPGAAASKTAAAQLARSLATGNGKRAAAEAASWPATASTRPPKRLDRRRRMTETSPRPIAPLRTGGHRTTRSKRLAAKIASSRVGQRRHARNVSSTPRCFATAVASGLSCKAQATGHYLAHAIISIVGVCCTIAARSLAHDASAARQRSTKEGATIMRSVVDAGSSSCRAAGPLHRWSPVGDLDKCCL